MLAKAKSIKMAAALLAASAISTSCIHAQEIPLEHRVTALEAKVSSLEKQIIDLRALIDNSARQGTNQKALPSKGSWRNASNWRYELRLGMSKRQVIELMGEPDKVEVYSLAGESWHYGYPFGGTISFSADGRVDHWSEPSPDDLK